MPHPPKYSLLLSEALQQFGSTFASSSTDYTPRHGGLNNSGESLWETPSNMQVYRTTAQSLDNRRRKFTETVGMSAFEYLQKLTFVKQRHHPESHNCAQGYPPLKKKTIKTTHKQRDNQEENSMNRCCHGQGHSRAAPQIIRQVQTVYVPVPTPTHPSPQILHQNHHSALHLQHQRHSISSIPKVNINYSTPTQPTFNQIIPIQHAPIQEVHITSPYQIMRSSRRVDNQSEVDSQMQETPRIMITQPTSQSERWKMPKEHIQPRYTPHPIHLSPNPKCPTHPTMLPNFSQKLNDSTESFHISHPLPWPSEAIAARFSQLIVRQ